MKYTIIIPHYNLPQLLQRAINSIPQRDDLEVIVVDDCSSEQNRLEVRRICKESPLRINLCEQAENKGGGAARNAGMELATGEFVMFMDADDLLNPCINDIMDDYAQDEHHDVIFFKSSSVDNETLEPRNRFDYLNVQIDKWLVNRGEGEIALRYFFGVPVCKIIRRKLLLDKQLKFDETRIHNDTTFAYMLGFAAGKIIADTRAGYCVTIREGSVSRQESDDLRLVTINILARAVLFFREKLGTDYAEDQLCFNLYILLRKKSYRYFEKGIDEVVKVGFKRNDVLSFFSKQMAIDSFKSTIWVIMFSPILKVRLLSFIDIFRYTIPSLFKTKND